MKKNITLIWVMTLFTTILFAQGNKDFIISMNHDTLYGKVKIKENSEAITFYHNKNKVNLHASVTTYFGVYQKGGTYDVYKSLINNWKEYIYVKVLSEGKVNLYYYDTSSSERYTSADPYRYYIGNAKQKPIRMSPRTYKKMIKLIIPEHPHIAEEVVDFADVPRVIKKYNQQYIRKDNLSGSN